MNRRFLAIGVLVTLSANSILAQSPSVPQPVEGASRKGWDVSGKQGVVGAGGAEAVEAGITLLKSGGNAADAGAATILALSVTDATQFCFGGEVPILVYDAQRRVVEVVAGQGAAP